MKCYYAILCSIFLNSIALPDEFTHLWDDFDHQALSKFSRTEELQLKYISDELEKYHVVAKESWVKNNNVKILTEMIQLIIEQASEQTKTKLKEKIVQIFQSFNINVFFNDQDLIELITTQQANRSYKKPLKFHHKKTSTDEIPSNTILHPTKIKGANRTRKKLEKAWNERKAAEKTLAQKTVKEPFQIKEPSPADLMEQIIREHEMEQHLKRTSEKSDERENVDLHGEL